ncbi:hypothetical protein ACFX1T_017060 [Malus domestica]
MKRASSTMGLQLMQLWLSTSARRRNMGVALLCPPVLPREVSSFMGKWDISPTNNLNGNNIGLLTRISVKENGEQSLDGPGLDDKPIRLAAPVQAIIAPNAVV